MIKAQGLSKLYGDTVAVRNVSFTVSRGEVVGFLGLNGAGKTTTLRMLTTFLAPTSGTAQIAGFDILSQSNEVRKQIGYLPETPPLYSELSVKEYLSFAAQIRGVKKERLKIAIENVIEKCGLDQVVNKLCGQLSKGFRQRVGIAQALIHSPSVVILDEPTSGLDPQQIVQIRELIASLKEDHTVILSTHVLPEVTAVCSHVVMINRGEIVLSDSLEHLLQQGQLEEVFLKVASGDYVLQEERNV